MKNIALTSFLILAHTVYAGASSSFTRRHRVLSPHGNRRLEGQSSYSRIASFQKFMDPGISRVLNETCVEYLDDSYWDHWDGITEASSCTEPPGGLGGKGCVFDFTTDLSNGSYDDAISMCKNEFGGDLYIFDAVITCADGSSYTFVNDVLSCFTSCNVQSAVNVTQFMWDAGTFAGGDNQDCTWDSLVVDVMVKIDDDDDKDDDLYYNDDEQIPFDDDDNDFMNCNEIYNESYWDHWKKFSVEDACITNTTTGSKNCTYDFTDIASGSAREGGGGYDKPLASCEKAGGEFYIFDGLINCPDGSSYTFINDVLSCYAECNERSAENAVRRRWKADDFLGTISEDNTNCVWDGLIATLMEGEEGGEGGGVVNDDEIPFDDDFNNNIDDEDPSEGDDGDNGEDNDDEVTTCTDLFDESYLDHWDGITNETNCIHSLNANGTTTKQCTYDFSALASSGGYDIYRYGCAHHGGDFYIYNASITCPDKSTYAFIDDVLSCFGGCNERYAERTALSLWTADDFILDDNQKNCTWDYLDAVIATSADGDVDDDLMACTELNDDTYWVHWEEVTNENSCIIDGDGGAEAKRNCTYDFTEVASSGGFDEALATCTGNGGELYIYDAVISCLDGSFYTFVNDVLQCFSASDCNEQSAENALQFHWPADKFLFDHNQTNCTWDAVSTRIMDGEGVDNDDEANNDDGVSFGDDEIPFDDDFNNMCSPVLDAEYLGALFGVLGLSVSINCEYDEDSIQMTCTYDFSSAFEDGGFKNLNELCVEADGNLFIQNTTYACDDGNVTTVSLYPMCLSSCSVNALKEYALFEGAEVDSNSDGCYYTSIDELYVYGPTATPTNEPTSPPTVSDPRRTLMPTSSTAPPTDEPTGYRRTLSPTMEPTVSNHPTMLPAPPSSDSSCTDSPLMFLVYDIPRCCKWVARDPQVRCNEMWAKGAQLDIDVKSHCPRSCGVCEEFGCSDTVGKFILDDVEDEECCSLDTLDDLKRGEKCSERRIHMTCQNTCGFCAE